MNSTRFVNQVIVVTLLAASCGWWFFRAEGGVPLFLGASWGSGNLWIIGQLVKQLGSSRKKYVKIMSLFFLKCPFIYVLGYLLLKSHPNHLFELLIGLSLLFAMLLGMGLLKNGKWLKVR